MAFGETVDGFIVTDGMCDATVRAMLRAEEPAG